MGEAATTGPRVLVVEDDLDTRDLICEVLREDGYPVSSAANGREALDVLAHDARPALILLDLMMPVMDGVAFSQALRLRPAVRDVPIVVISADGNPQRAAAVGAVGYLAKPFDIEALLAQVAGIARDAEAGPPPATL